MIGDRNRGGVAVAISLLLASCGTAPPLRIAITVDDLPVHSPYPPGLTALEVNRQMVAALKAANAPATAFVNAVNVKDAPTLDALKASFGGGGP